jgi:uncharacterized membrane protein
VNAVRRSFVTGVLTLLPLALTYWCFRFLFNLFDGLLGPAADRAIGRHVPGVGLVVSILLIIAVGAVASNVAGKKILAYLSKILENTPLVKSVYTASRQMVTALSPRGEGLKRVVLIEYPRRGVYAIGFLTSRLDWMSPAGGDRKWVSVLVPAALNPTSGNVVVVPEEELLDPGFSVEEGVKLVVSGGFVAPEKKNAGANRE